MEFLNRCFCGERYRGPFLLDVNSSEKVTSAVYAEGSPEDLVGTYAGDRIPVMTIQDAFDQIQQALDRNADDVRVTYDSKAGYPSEVYIDWDESTVDEETRIRISNVEAASGGASYDKDLEHILVTTNEKKWQIFTAASGCGYQMELFNHWSGREINRLFLVYVNSAEELLGSVYLDGLPEGGSVISIKKAFDNIQEALDQNADVVRVSYDSKKGYPSDIYIDWDETKAGDERSITISNVEATHCGVQSWFNK